VFTGSEHVGTILNLKCNGNCNPFVNWKFPMEQFTCVMDTCTPKNTAHVPTMQEKDQLLCRITTLVCTGDRQVPLVRPWPVSSVRTQSPAPEVITQLLVVPSGCTRILNVRSGKSKNITFLKMKAKQVTREFSNLPKKTFNIVHLVS
jgi:hypothetical protein